MPPKETASASNFLRTIVEHDIASGRLAGRHWRGAPGVAGDTAHTPTDPSVICTRFPPEPNGYLHIGHAKSICLNFGLARDFGGRCHLRFDDTNPVKEDQEYVDSIIDAVRWLGFDWRDDQGEHLYYASDYFETFYRIAEYLIGAGHAYVDSQDADAIRAGRGTLTEPGINSPFRDRPPQESLILLREMRQGLHAEGRHVLRARIDMTAPNMNLRDPVLYRVRFAEHHRTANAWCLYPMYDFAHPLSDAMENITHSICTLEFESHRPLYDWLVERAAEGGFFRPPLPHQYEFARLNLTYTVTSKRKLQELVQLGRVGGWDDPRMPTLVGLRRRGYTPESIRLFCERIGVARADSWIDMGSLEQALRDDLESRVPRTWAVLDPLRLILDNVDPGHEESCRAARHPQQPELGQREFPLTRELWIEREDFKSTPPKGFFRLFPGNLVRLRHGHVIRCTGCDVDETGQVVAVHAEVMPDSKSGTPGADQYKVKGNLHWISVRHARAVEVRLYDRLFTQAHPDAGGHDYMEALNPSSVRVVIAQVGDELARAAAGERFQFERHGYFVADSDLDASGRRVFNRAVSLKDSWGSARS